MITYMYECDACEIAFEVKQSIKAEKHANCPKCGKDIYERVWTNSVPLYVRVIGEPTTIGQIADRNAKKLSQEQMDMAAESYKTKKVIDRIPDEHKPKSIADDTPKGDVPEWITKNRSKSTKEVIAMTPEQTKKYVQEGA